LLSAFAEVLTPQISEVVAEQTVFDSIIWQLRLTAILLMDFRTERLFGYWRLDGNSEIGQFGTPRMIFDLSGSLTSVSRHDYLPFGEEIYSGVDGHLTTEGYAGDSAREKYTGKERDAETALDFFGARYCSPAEGRC